MRTTVTLDADVESLLQRAMAERGISFKQALNDAIRASARSEPDLATATTVRRLGRPTADLTHALRLAGEQEDAELTRRMRVGQ